MTGERKTGLYLKLFITEGFSLQILDRVLKTQLSDDGCVFSLSGALRSDPIGIFKRGSRFIMTPPLGWARLPAFATYAPFSSLKSTLNLTSVQKRIQIYQENKEKPTRIKRP